MAQSYLESLLSEREKIILVARQHWFTLASMIFLEIFLILIFLTVTVMLAILFPEFALLIVAIGFALILIPVFTMTRDILHWSNAQFIITNRRVMQLAGVINKSVTDSNLEKVNDVKMSQSAIGRMFDYGDIEILTASELGVNKFRRIESPVNFKTAMLNAKEHLDRDDDLPRGGRPADNSIPGLIAQLDELRRQGVLSEAEFQEKKAALLAKLT